jgi:hypothetical protein
LISAVVLAKIGRDALDRVGGYPRNPVKYGNVQRKKRLNIQSFHGGKFMSNKDLGMDISLKVGQLIKTIDAIVAGLNVMRNEMAKNEYLYCHECGEKLQFSTEISDLKFVCKICPNCNQIVGWPRKIYNAKMIELGLTDESEVTVNTVNAAGEIDPRKTAHNIAEVIRTTGITGGK